MASPGKDVEEFSDDPISFGKGGQKKYDGFAYSLDYNLSLMDPSRMTISFISDDREYDEDALKEDIVTNGTKESPHKINYCGDRRTFYGYPLKYSINRSPRGDILTVDYYDASIIELDNIFVLLNKEDMPSTDGQNQANPCERRLFNLGTEHVKREGGVPKANSSCIDDSELTKEVLYTNHDLAELIEEHVPVNLSTLEILSPKDAQGDPDGALTYLENYHGTLREVLKSWGERMGFTFYWEVPEGGGDSEKNYGQLTFLNLKDPLFYDSLKVVADKMLGKAKSGGACNLLDSTEALSMEQTFNKAISARYENARIGDGSKSTKFMTLDMFTLPVRGCATDEGRAWGEGKFKGDIHPTQAPWSKGSPQYYWRNSNATWYQEWDSPNYNPGAENKDKQDRRWMEYQPKRPFDRGEHNDVVKEEFRDYIRLVKAAAIGEDFFNAYVFFKMMKKPKNKTKILSLAGYCRQHPVNSGLPPDVNDDNTLIQPMNCRDAVRTILQNKQRILSSPTSKNAFLPDDNLDDKGLAKALESCCGKEADPNSLTKAENYYVELNDGYTDEFNPGVTDRNGEIIIPDLVENKALSKILSKDAAGEEALVDTPNIRLCRGTVLGADCLTVNVLDPTFRATQALYQLTSNQIGPCGNKNQELQIDLVDESDNVYRVNHLESRQDQQGKDAQDNGSPYVFTSMFNFGNNGIFDRTGHGALYSQLSLVGRTAGRFWISPELLTKREFDAREYSDPDISWVNRLLDVNDSKFRSIFQEFDPLSGRAQAPWNDGGDTTYNVFWGTDFTKSSESKQKQLKGWEGQKEKDGSNCSYKDGKSFGPQASDTEENTRAPNVEQMIQKIIEKTMENSTELCYQGETMKDLAPAEMTILEDGLIKKYDEDGELEGYKFMGNYKAGGGQVNGQTSLVGGHGYSEASNAGRGPEVKITAEGIENGPVVATAIIDGSSIVMIVIENADSVLLKPGKNGGAPDIQVEINEPAGGEVNFFGDLKADTEMSEMDSITATNLNLRKYQQRKSCCCDDLEPGVVMIDKGEMLKVSFNAQVRKQIERISSATNETISSANSSNLVKDYKKDNKVITFSTNLIELSNLDGTVSPDAEDELDWIVDQVRIGAEGVDPTYKNSFYVAITDEEDAGGPTMKNCMLETERTSYMDRGNPFEAVVLGIPEEVENGPHPFVVKTISNPQQDDAILGCDGFMGGGLAGSSTGVNVREMKIEFATPSSDDIGVEFECGKDWEDLTDEEKTEKLEEIQTKLIEFVKKRAYLQNNNSYEASVTIADNFIKDSNGKALEFNAGGSKSKGIPNISQGLESLSIRIDGNGQRITIGVGTRKKLLGLRDPSFNLWRDINPRDMNVIQPNGGAGA